MTLRPRAAARRQFVGMLAAACLAIALSGCLPGPRLTTSIVVSGLDHPWDVGFAGGTMIYTERDGRISAFVGGQKRLLADPTDVVTASEAGMMGLAVDPSFASNRYIYTCHASTLGDPANDVRVVRWTVDAGFRALTNRTDIITGLPVNASGELGRHSGCRPRFGLDGYLWIGTGDAAIGSVPQDPNSLGGKVLRVTRSGAGAPGNPGGSLDPRIYSYGHRNVQGLAFRASDGLGVSTEHGPDRDDELNRLVTGNFGWDPVPGYNESVPMTDLQKFPGAVRATWSSGVPTQAPSGATFLAGDEWGNWDGALAVAELKGERLLVFGLDAQARPTGSASSLTDRGRLRSAAVGPGNDLYITTDNGGNADVILRVTPP